MNFLVLTDFHGSRKALDELARLLNQKKYDAVLMLGDMINPRNDELPYLESCLDLVQKIHGLPTFALHGNNEPEPAYKIYRERGVNIHLETKQFGGYNICGLGGFGYLNEPGFEDLTVENLIINERTIFITHVPPRTSEVQLRGPLVHLFGHLHTLAYSKQLGPTLRIQCPAGNLGRVSELELPQLKVTFIDI